MTSFAGFWLMGSPLGVLPGEEMTSSHRSLMPETGEIFQLSVRRTPEFCASTLGLSAGVRECVGVLLVGVAALTKIGIDRQADGRAGPDLAVGHREDPHLVLL